MNVGGFLAAFVMMFLVGTILDAFPATGQTVFAWANFRIALTVQYVVVGFGVAMLLHARHRTRRCCTNRREYASARSGLHWLHVCGSAACNNDYGPIGPS